MKILIKSLAMAVLMILVMMLAMFITGLFRRWFDNDIAVVVFILLLPLETLIVLTANSWLDGILEI